MRLSKIVLALITVALIIVGLGLVTYFVTLSPIRSSDEFTEVYFIDTNRLPKVLRVGEPVNVTFVIRSHERGTLNYTYLVFFGDKLIARDIVTLDPLQSVMIACTFVPNSTTLILYDNSTSRSEVILPVSFYELYFLQLEKKYVPLAPIGGNLSMIYSNRTFNLIKGNYILVPSPLRPSAFLILPLSRLPLQYQYTDVHRVGDPEHLVITESGLANFGYDKTITKYIVTRRSSNAITIQHYTQYIKYRYKFKKISVKVISGKGTKYEIHFWVVVTGPPPH